MKFKHLKLLPICLLTVGGVLSSPLLLTSCSKEETSITITNTPDDIYGQVSVDDVTSYTQLVCENNRGETLTDVEYSVSPTLPAGLEINEDTGVISGTATEECDDTYIIQTSYDNLTATVNLHILINNDPSNYVGNANGTN
jgi:hypothetical protein